MEKRPWCLTSRLEAGLSLARLSRLERKGKQGKKGSGDYLNENGDGKRCATPGCDKPVKKSTARYCSIRCCAKDPVRIERLRRQARRAPIVPLAHQLSMVFQVHQDMEASLDERTLSREDVPGGLQRLRAS